jgi:hypothetical protein
MADLEVTNWFGDLVSHPRVIVDANSVDDIVAVMKDATKYSGAGARGRLQPFNCAMRGRGWTHPSSNEDESHSQDRR